MRTIKFKRTLSAATAAIMALSVLTGTAPGTIGKIFEGNTISVSAATLSDVKLQHNEETAVAITSNAATVTYGETGWKIVPTALNDGVFTYESATQATATVDDQGNITTAGVGTTAITVTETYTDGESQTQTNTYTFTLTVEAASITPTLNINSNTATWSYDNESKSITVGGNTGNGSVTYKYITATTEPSTDDWSSATTTEQPKTVGTHWVQATIEANGNYAAGSVVGSYEITKASFPSSDITVSVDDLTVGSTPNPTVTGKPSWLTGTPSYTYKQKSGDNYIDVNGEPNSVGTYKAVATFTGTDNYDGGTVESADFTISAAAATIGDATANSSVWSDGNTKEFSNEPYTLLSDAPSVENGTAVYKLEKKAIGADDSTYTAVTGFTDFKVVDDANLATILSVTDAGVYRLSYKAQATDENYSDSAVKTLVFTVTQKEATGKSISAISQLKYNGGAQDLVEATGTETGGTTYYAVAASEPETSASVWSTTVPSETDQGSYNVWTYVKADSSGNYKDSEVSSATAVTIGAADLTIAGMTMTITYGEDVDDEDIATKLGSSAAVTFTKANSTTETVEGTWSWTSSTNTATLNVEDNESTRTKTLTFTPESSNFNTKTDVNVVITVEPADISTMTASLISDIEVGDSVVLPTDVTISGLTVDTDFDIEKTDSNVNYYTKSGSTYTKVDGNINKTVAATYYIKATGKGNYSGDLYVPFKLTNGNATVATAPVAKSGLKYNGQAQKLLETAGTATNGTMLYRVIEDDENTPSTPEYDGTENWVTADELNATEIGTYHIYYVAVGSTGFGNSVVGHLDGVVKVAPNTVTFNTNGGSTIANTPTGSLGKVTKPSNPEKSGYAFIDWYENSACTGDPFDFDTVLTSDKTLYAKWAKVLTVTYNAGTGGTPNLSVTTGTVNSGYTLTPPTAPTNSDTTFVFDGWYDANNKLFDFSKPVTGEDNFTLTAHWATAVTVSGTISGTSESGSVNVSKTGSDLTTNNAAGIKAVVNDADNKIPDGATAVLKIKSDSIDPDEANAFNLKAGTDKDAVALIAFNIGVYVTPSGGSETETNVTLKQALTITLTLDNPLNSSIDTDNLWIYHQVDGTNTIKKYKATYDGNVTITFQIDANDSFSPFTLVEEKPNGNASGHSGSSVDYETVTDGGITYHVYSDHAEVAEVDTATETAVIKDKVGGKNVTVIAENAFNSCTALKSVTIPATVETIEASAFWGCKALTEITIPETVKTINKDAFKRCTALKTINGVKGSAAETFANANGYTFKDTSTPGTPETPDTDKLTATNVAIDKNGKVTWDAAEDAAEYKVFKKIGGKIYNTGWITKTEFTFDSIPTVNFEVYVASRNAGKSAVKYSEHVAVTGAKPLGTAANVKVTDAGKVTWTAAANAKYYKVVKVVNGKEYSKTVKTGTSTTISVPVSDYKVYVTAVGQYNTTTNSEVKDVTVKNALGYVNEVTVDKNGKVTWTKASNAVEYKVGKVMNGKTYWTKKVTGTSVTIKPAKKDYQVFVVAFNKDGKKTWGAKNLVEVGNLGTVLDPKVDANGNVTWTAARNAVKYKVGKTVNGKTYYTGELTTNSATIKVPKSDYKVFVVAFDKDGNKTWGTKVDVKVK